MKAQIPLTLLVLSNSGNTKSFKYVDRVDTKSPAIVLSFVGPSFNTTGVAPFGKHFE
jgi:hypothetical protein